MNIFVTIRTNYLNAQKNVLKNALYINNCIIKKYKSYKFMKFDNNIKKQNKQL